MPIPDFQTLMLPLLTAIGDGLVHEVRDVKKKLIEKYGLTAEELKEMLPSRRAYLFDNRLGWANTYLKKAGLVGSQRRGSLQITDAGKAVLAEGRQELKVADLKRFPSFVEFHTVKGQGNLPESTPEPVMSDQSPEETIDGLFETLKQNLATEIIAAIMSCSPRFFEKLVIELLVSMGYGGSRAEAGQAVGRSGDGGIDGIINEDKLGLDSIYLQAKRWDNPVPVKEIRDFAGSLLGRKARKGVFITTSEFSKSAYEFVESIEHRIVLIDGKRLAELMIEHGIGVSKKIVYEIKDLDKDYFEEDG